MNARRSFAVALLVVAAFAGLGASTFAQSQINGPTVVPDRYELTPGERVQLTVVGFRSGVVNMAFCGNEGRRGTADCDVRGTQAREINPDGTPTLAEMPVSAPPTPCPCIIRVSSQDNLEIAVAPITLVGHPVGDVVGGTGFDTSLSVDIVANAAPAGLSDEIRSSLGGPSSYDVTVVVRNRATFSVDQVAVAATFTRGNYDDTRSIELTDPGPMAPGETWEETVQVDVPSLTRGEVTWSATASGQGPAVTATDTTTSQPVLLIVLAVVLVVDLLLLMWRLVVRIRQRRPPAAPDHTPFLDRPDDPDAGDAVEFDDTLTTQPQRQLVG